MSKEQDQMVLDEWRKWLWGFPIDYEDVSENSPFSEELQEEGFWFDKKTKEWKPPK